MDAANSDQLQLKKILVDLEDEHKHLQASIEHLQNEIDKREIEIRRLIADRELELARENTQFQVVNQLRKSKSVDFHQQAKKNIPANSAEGEINSASNLNSNFSSEFVKQVNQLLINITRTSEEVSELIRL